MNITDLSELWSDDECWLRFENNKRGGDPIAFWNDMIVFPDRKNHADIVPGKSYYCKIEVKGNTGFATILDEDLLDEPQIPEPVVAETDVEPKLEPKETPPVPEPEPEPAPTKEPEPPAAPQVPPPQVVQGISQEDLDNMREQLLREAKDEANMAMLRALQVVPLELDETVEEADDERILTRLRPTRMPDEFESDVDRAEFMMVEMLYTRACWSAKHMSVVRLQQGKVSRYEGPIRAKAIKSLIRRGWLFPHGKRPEEQVSLDAKYVAEILQFLGVDLHQPPPATEEESQAQVEEFVRAKTYLKDHASLDNQIKSLRQQLKDVATTKPAPVTTAPVATGKDHSKEIESITGKINGLREGYQNIKQQLKQLTNKTSRSDTKAKKNTGEGMDWNQALVLWLMERQGLDLAAFMEWNSGRRMEPFQSACTVCEKPATKWTPITRVNRDPLTLPICDDHDEKVIVDTYGINVSRPHYDRILNTIRATIKDYGPAAKTLDDVILLACSNQHKQGMAKKARQGFHTYKGPKRRSSYPIPQPRRAVQNSEEE